MPPHTQAEMDNWHESDKKRKYLQPASLIGGTVWRVWIWTETTFALSLMEPWEIILIFAIFGVMSLFIIVGLVRYFPHAIVSASRRAQYYFSGSDALVEGFKDDTWVTGRVEL